MITVLIEEDELLDMLIDRVRFWTDDKDVINLYEKMYEDMVNGGCFEDSELNIRDIVDNDYVNWCSILYEDDSNFIDYLDEYKENGIGDRIMAVNDRENPTMILIRW